MTARATYELAAALMAKDRTTIEEAREIQAMLNEIDELRDVNAALRHTLYGADDLLRGISGR